ncbi:MAG TPA: aminotransferase class III-fold pyridoxal phosphate-dependent enzyme [Longimicrobiales bacterium]|nr:aminotransferase class III-fold pyridoxal phosphate-dependent enzyme [Longimicrobiales bacterium]
MSTGLLGDELPHLITDVPGPRSRALTDRLARVESPNITAIEPAPICWTEARGAAVRDADDNIFIDLTAGFGVAHAGHANDAVAAAIADQAARLAHGLGDVYPPEPKVRLLERLAAIAPGDLSMTILAGSGAEAVEAALKTAVVRSGRTGILAFEGAYHGLTYGALATTWRSDFRARFSAQLFDGVRFAPYPITGTAAPSLEAVDRIIADAEASPHPIGAIIVEPVLGRGGLHVPPDGFLTALRERCDGDRTLLILDEVYTGCGRTGRWFACEHEGVVPDVLVVGKALSGSLPISAAIGTPPVMRAWPVSTGEAIHTSTFLGNPIACAAALAQLDAIQNGDLLRRAERLGEAIREKTTSWAMRFDDVGPPRGCGLLQGAPMRGAGQALRVADRCLRRGVLLLAEGTAAEVLAITPPAVITEAQLDFALAVVEESIRAELE